MDFHARSMAGSKLKLLLCVPTLNVGGSERILTHIATHISPAKFDVLVCCISEAGVLAAELETNEITLRVMSKRGRFDIQTFARLNRLLLEVEPDIVHAFLFTAGFWMLPVAYVRRVPVRIYGIRSVSDRSPRSVHLLERHFILPFANHVVFVSESARDNFNQVYKFPRVNTTVVRNGIPLTIFRNNGGSPGESPIILGMIGRLDKAKGHEVAFKAFQKIQILHPNTQLWIIGDGPRREELIGLAKHLGIEERTKFLGERLDIPGLLARIHCVISSSHWEGIPVSLLEAMASGKAIVATRVGGVPEILDDDCALLIPPDDPEALIEGILRYIQHPALIDIYGKRAQQKVEAQFSIEKMIQDYEGLYQQLVYDCRR